MLSNLQLTNLMLPDEIIEAGYSVGRRRGCQPSTGPELVAGCRSVPSGAMVAMTW